MTQSLEQPLIESVHSVLSMMTKTACRPIEGTEEMQACDDEHVIGSMSISGDVEAQVRLVFPSTTGVALVQRMTGMSELPPECVDDALGELCNMIVGSAKSSLSLENAALSCPSMSRESCSDQSGTCTGTPGGAITTLFDSEAGPFSLVLTQAA